MRLFQLVRDEDESGVSGTGVVAQGVEFDNGRVAMTWLKSHLGMTGNYDNITVMLKVHGHGGKTKVEWVYDTDPSNSPPDPDIAMDDPVSAQEDEESKDDQNGDS